MADAALLLDADVDEAAPGGELVVDGERLALREGAGDEGDVYLVGGGVVGARPHHLVHAQVLWPELGHPRLAVGGDMESTVGWKPDGSGWRILVCSMAASSLAGD